MSPQPDLSITGFSPPGTIGRGIYYTIPTTVSRTGGSLPGGSVLVRIYLSRDTTWSTDDYRASLDYSASSFSAATLNGSGSLRQSVECAPGDISLSPPRLDTGFYYWIAVVDPGGSYAESNESNNAFIGGSVTVY